MSSATIITVLHGVIAVCIVVAATVLLALHDIDSSLAIALYGGSIGLVGGTTNALLALKVPPSSSSGS